VCWRPKKNALLSFKEAAFIAKGLFKRRAGDCFSVQVPLTYGRTFQRLT
jgi:hypothetical protein